MKPMPHSLLTSRRQFLRQMAGATLGTIALSSLVRDLRLVNAAVAQTAITDYKALVCIFLMGGNDANNLVIPIDATGYSQYAAIRTPVLALPKLSVLPIAPLNSDGHSYGFHPCCPGLQTLFAEKKLAVLFNTGTLVYPINRAQYLAGSVPKPTQLYSHGDQMTQWETSVTDQPTITGWGGRCADLLNSVQPNSPISMCLNLYGANTFQVGNLVSQYYVTPQGAVSLSGVYGPRQQALTNILKQPYANLQAQAYAKVAQNSIDTGALLNNAIQPTASPSYWAVPFPTVTTTPTSGVQMQSYLGKSLQMIARLIEAGQRSTAAGGFGMRRQVFFTATSGNYDHHISQTGGAGQATVGVHADLLAELSQCLLVFQRAMEQLGLSNSVTTFTASEFGRTLASNGQGSDHGWGSHHLVLGGAVNGQRTYGAFPDLTLDGPDDAGTGRWIPTTAIDQYFATLATWFGVDASNLSTVLPNLGRFASSNLGFV